MKEKKSNRIPVKTTLSIIFISLFGTLILSFLIVNFRYEDSHLAEARYLIVVPGAGVTRDGNPSTALRKRLDKALEIYKAGMAQKIYISGTQYEVIAMERYLLNHEIKADVIIIDDKGINTYQTVDNISRYIKEKHLTNGLAFVSQRYHLPRIALFARRQNLRHAALVAADHKGVKAESRSRFILRETLAYYKALWLNH